MSGRSPLKTDRFSGRVSPCPSVRTIARLIADAPDKMRCIPQRLNAKGQTKRPFKRRCRARKPKHFKAQYPGHCIALDTIVRYQHGVRRTILTAINVHTRMAIAVATNRCNSRNAAAFLRLTLACIVSVLPQPGKVLVVHDETWFCQ